LGWGADGSKKARRAKGEAHVGKVMIEALFKACLKIKQ
jgi:hypothetical protein